MVEQGTFNPEVRGSIPLGGIMKSEYSGYYILWLLTEPLPQVKVQIWQPFTKWNLTWSKFQAALMKFYIIPKFPKLNLPSLPDKARYGGHAVYFDCVINGTRNGL